MTADEQARNSGPHDVDASLMPVAERIVDRLLRSTKRLVRLLAVGGALLALVVAVMGWLFYQQHQSAVSSCEYGNSRSAADQQHWDLFLGILLKGNTNKTDLALGKQIMDSIARSDAPRDCTQVYGIIP